MDSLKNKPPRSGTIVELAKRLWPHLSRRRKYQLAFVMVLMLVSGLTEVISLGAVIPFLGVLSNPIPVFKHLGISHMASLLGIVTAEQLILPVTVFFAVAALLAGAVRILQVWVESRYAHAVGHDLSPSAYSLTLYQPYKRHLERNSSEVISGVAKVDGLMPFMQQLLGIASAFIKAIFVVLALIVIDPVVAILAFTGFAIIYGLLAWLTRQILRRNSVQLAQLQIVKLKTLQEGLGGIRDVILGGYQSMYTDIYGNADLTYRRADTVNLFIGLSPRHAVEALSMVLIAFLAYGISRQPGGIIAVIPIMGALVLGAQRLLPTLQQIYTNFIAIAGNRASLEDALDLLEQPMPKDVFLSPILPLDFKQDIRFDSVKFRYNHEGPLVLDGLNLTIPRGVRIGFVGRTGSGKSTTLDLFMGLLTPTSGQIFVDGVPLHGENMRAWQRTIAHVPQNIFLPDATLTENIAFGESPDSIDIDRVKMAAQQACIAEFIEGCPEGYSTLVGERGVRLSGGQRQRIGIARALYRQATVLVFDEATSALDNATEQVVMDAIEKLGRDLTIIIIAHRLTTVRRCDTIVELDQGRVFAQGAYEQLVEQSQSFREMAQIAGKAKQKPCKKEGWADV